MAPKPRRGSGFLDVPELVQGLMRLRGGADGSLERRLFVCPAVARDRCPAVARASSAVTDIQALRFDNAAFVTYVLLQWGRDAVCSLWSWLRG